MEKTKHTPGPWETKDGQEVMAESGMRLIAQCHAGHREERGANARLIAAAPDLLEACKKAFDNIANMDAPQSLQDKGRKLAALSTLGMAISRADGKE